MLCAAYTSFQMDLYRRAGDIECLGAPEIDIRARINNIKKKN